MGSSRGGWVAAAGSVAEVGMRLKDRIWRSRGRGDDLGLAHLLPGQTGLFPVSFFLSENNPGFFLFSET